MTKTPAIRMLLAGFVVFIGSVTHASAQAPAPAQMLDSKLGPKFADVNITVPTPEELKSCTVKLVQGAAPKSNGWLLMDGKGQPLRRYFDSNGDGKVDLWSYYKDGVEVYREFDSAFKGTPDNFRWLNAGGMKWGIGSFDNQAKEWRVNSWRMISAEEVGFEAFHAVANNDFARLQALFISDAEMQGIKLPASKVQAIGATQHQAAKKFSTLQQTVKLAGVKFDGVEGATPGCDTSNGDSEIIKYASRAIRYMNKDKHGWIHTGEMIQVGMASWRLVDVPSDKDGGGVIEPKIAATNPQLDKLLKDLADLDEKFSPPPAPILSKNEKVESYYRKRIELVRNIIPLVKDAEQESWYKQYFDNLTAMAQNSGDKAAIGMLSQMKDDVATKMPGSNLAAYGVYREMWTRYAVGMAATTNQKEIAGLQDKWLDDLTDFVKKYSKADDTADSLGQLAIGCEFAGKVEESKRWYKELSTSFPDTYHAPRARGSLARLNLVGSEMKLAAPLLNDPATTFDIAKLKGKVVIVHYWATASTTHQADFAVLKQIMGQVKSDVELVCISLDDDAAKAKETIAKAQVPGVHLYQATNNASGLNSPLATQYGIHILPTMFMVGRNGLVTNNALQMGDITTELKKVQ
jgi:hypothetical protein